MTITKYDGVAILPKRCNRCNRLFWLEPYNIFYKFVGIEEYPLKQIECKDCIDKKVRETMAEINIEKMAQNVAEKAIQELKDNGVFVSRWIPVSEGLPSDDKEVFIYLWGSQLYIAWISDGEWRTDEFFIDKECEPIAWMPLPKPYEPQEREE